MKNKSVIFFSKVLSGFLPVLLLWSVGVSQQEQKSPGSKLDLNNASYEEIAGLPIPPAMAEKIYDRITFQGPLKSVFELNQIAGMTPELFLLIKPLVRIEPYIPKSERERRLDEFYRTLSRWKG